MASNVVKRWRGAGGFPAAWSRTARKVKDVRRDLLLTGGFTLGSVGVSDVYGRGWGLIAACGFAIAYEYHLGHRE